MRVGQSSGFRAAWALCVALVLAAGCRSRGTPFHACTDEKAGDYYASTAADIDYPAVNQCTLEQPCMAIESLPPRTLSADDPPDYREVTLEEVIRMGLANSNVLRDLGGAVLRSPGATRTIYDPALQETDPTYGVEAALSAFDAQFTTSLFFENNDRAINNQFLGGGTRIYTQDAAAHQMQLTKRAATGTELSARQTIEYDSSRDGVMGGRLPGNRFFSAYTVKVEGEVRHPLMQGAGLQYNRIAGPTETPGVYNGVLIARLNTDIQTAEFEIAVRNLVSNLENAYWDLYFAYRDLDAKIAARDSALDTWRRVQALYETGRQGGEAEKEAQAREQYFRFQEEVENALAGRLVDGTRTYNGSAGGTFRGSGGVYATERRLRRLMNLPAADGELLRPASDPVVAAVAFDWDQVTLEAADRRAELRRQKWNIRRRELELIASRNHLLPSLDAVGRYRFRGFGHDLLDEDNPSIGRFDNAYEDLTTGDFQEWQLGVELDIPIGFRRAHAGVRNAQLRLARARAVLCDQQQEVVHEAASAVAEVDRAFEVSQTTFNRLMAARAQVDALRALFDTGKAELNLYLDAQQRLADAQSRYYRSLAEYAVAIKNAHFAKGTLLEFDGVYLAEGPWPNKAYVDAQQLEARRGPPRALNYATRRAPAVSLGAYAQQRGARPPAILPAPPPGGAPPTDEQIPPADSDGPQPAPQAPRIEPANSAGPSGPPTADAPNASMLPPADSPAE